MPPSSAELARRTFYDTFAATNDAADMALHLAGAYSVDIQTRELNDRDITTLLVEEGGDGDRVCADARRITFPTA